MKSARRHELQTNVLARWLNEKVDAVKPYSRLIVGVILAIVIAVLAYTYFTRKGATEQAGGWADYAVFSDQAKPQSPTEMAFAIDRLEAVAKKHGDSSVGLWSRERAARLQLSQASSAIWKDRKIADQWTDKAIEHYQIISRKADVALLERLGIYGLGQAYEMKAATVETADESKKYRDLAIQQYKSLATDSSETVLGKKAQQAVTRLEASGEFLPWYATESEALLAQSPGVLPGGSSSGSQPGGTHDFSAIRKALTDDPGGDKKPKPTPGGEPKSGEPKTGEPKTGGPMTGEPKTGEPKTGEPKTGEPKTGEPKTGEPKAGGPMTGEPKSAEPKNDPPKEAAPKTGQPDDQKPKAGQPKTAAPKAGGSKDGQPKLNPPSGEQPKQGADNAKSGDPAKSPGADQPAKPAKQEGGDNTPAPKKM